MASKLLAIDAIQAAIEAYRAGERDKAVDCLKRSTLALPTLREPSAADQISFEPILREAGVHGCDSLPCWHDPLPHEADTKRKGSFFYWRALLAYSCKAYRQAHADVTLALVLAPGNAQMLALSAEIFKALGELSAAINAYEDALALAPSRVAWRYNLALCFEASEQWAKAIVAYEAVLAKEPKHAAALNHLALLFNDAGDPASAQALWTQALHNDPQDVAARLNRALLWLSGGQHKQAQEELEKLVDASPQQVRALIALGGLHAAGKAPELARGYLQAAYALAPGEPFLLGQLMMCCLQLAEWHELPRYEQKLCEAMAQGEPACTPFSLLALADEPMWHLQAARAFLARQAPRIKTAVQAAPQGEAVPRKAHSGRIKLGYFSSDFHEHATAYLIAELIETHDRAQFEVFLFSYGKTTDDAMQSRLRQAADHFIELGTWSDRDIVALAKRLEIELAVDLKGYTYLSRPMLFAARLAPVQVSYLGYPGSLGLQTMDYVVGDQVVFGADWEKEAYPEQWVRLPGSYQVNDACWHADAAIAQACAGDERKHQRMAHGLDPQGLVYCCFNNTYKISQAVFDDWMAILEALPASQLWLLQDNEHAMQQLRRHARARGIDAQRLVFAPRLSRSAHLQRHGLADVFLDTFPYNAHTTASDALRCGLPLITRKGQSFASRVAASLLEALGMGMLVTQTPSDYLRLAIALGQDPVRLAMCRDGLAKALAQREVFAANGVRAPLEAAYRSMVERARAGLEAAPIDVDAHGVVRIHDAGANHDTQPAAPWPAAP